MFESHAHYNDKSYDVDRDELLSQLPACGIDYVVNAGESMRSIDSAIALADKYDFFYASIGVHPHNVSKMSLSDLDILKKKSMHPKVVAIGEIGLDFHYDFSPRDVQRHFFMAQLDLAKDVDLPVIIHSREACNETFNIIKDSSIRNGVIHCFSGSSEMALAYVRLGFYIGVGGVVTFSKARTLVEVVNAIGIENILIETDCPYLSPEPNRGKRNDSRNLKYIVQKIAQIKNITEDKVSSVTTQNALNLWTKIKP